jgi:hypothetical protein
MQELQIKAKEAEIKEKKVMIDAAARADELKLKEQELALKGELEGAKLGHTISKSKEELSMKGELEGVKLGAMMAKDRAAASKPETPTQKD